MSIKKLLIAETDSKGKVSNLFFCAEREGGITIKDNQIAIEAAFANPMMISWEDKGRISELSVDELNSIALYLSGYLSAKITVQQLFELVCAKSFFG